MTFEDVNILCQEIAAENAEKRMNEYADELEENALYQMMAEHEQMLHACMSYDLDAEYYGE